MTHGLYFFTAAILAALAFVLLQLSTIGRHLMATQADVDALVVQVVKIGDEVKSAAAVLKAELESVKEQLAAAGAAETVDLTGLAAAIQVVDDINPDYVEEDVVEDVEDAPVDVPVEDAPAE